MSNPVILVCILLIMLTYHVLAPDDAPAARAQTGAGPVTARAG